MQTPWQHRLFSRPGCPSVLPQVRLRYDAEIAQQSHGGEAVGAALDQKLPVRGAVEEDAPQLLLSAAGAAGAELRAAGSAADNATAAAPTLIFLP